jgi:hypothetical protein
LLIAGYRPLSGRPLAAAAIDETLPDPYEPHVAALRTAALARDAALAFDTRNALYEGTAAGRFGDYGRAVAERAWTITQRDVDELLADGVSEDEVFEAAICVALGAATRRLNPLLSAVRTVSAAGETAMP